MTPSELAERNLAVAFDVFRLALADEAVSKGLASFSSDGPILLIDPTDSATAKANDALIAYLGEHGQHVVGIQVDRTVTLQPR